MTTSDGWPEGLPAGGFGSRGAATANDSVAFADPDGRQVIFAPWSFGQEMSPARRKAAH